MMRARLALVVLAAAAGCGDDTTISPGLLDAPDAGAPPSIDAAAPDGVEDLDVTLATFASLDGLMTPAGRGYRVANLLGHEAEALAAASSATGAPFPVGSIVEVQASEAMVKRRAGFDATTSDWEFLRITFGSDGKTPESFAVRGTAETACFTCHAMVSSPTWDFICDHP